jgi:hypothetical protein
MSITPNTKVTLAVGTVVVCVVAIVGASWRIANYVRDMKDELSAIRRDVAVVAADRWTVGDMERWSYRLERENRDRINLTVPEVRPVRNESPGPQL